MKINKFVLLPIAITLLLSLTLLSNPFQFQTQTNKIYLGWKNSEDAVIYELEIMKRPYEPTEVILEKDLIYHNADIFSPGVELDLNKITIEATDKTYYRVRPLDLDRKPIAAFSKPLPLTNGELNPTKPHPTAFYDKNRPAPLYPTYSWIPVLEAKHYIVEITKGAPENPNGTKPSSKQVYSYTLDESYDYYDTHPYVEEGTYYWRVIALNSYYSPIGTYSDAIPFQVSPRKYTIAVFGDSITHGGGAVSNPPSDIRFDYSYYIPYEVKNLGRSGDSVESLVERFDHDVLPFQPTYLFILGGGNSIRGGAKAEDLIEQFQKLIKKCERNHITPIFLTIPPINPDRVERVFDKPSAEDWQEQTDKVNAFLKDQQYVIDINALLRDEQGILPTMYSQDGLHPDISAKKIMGKAATSFLRTLDKL